MIPKFLASLILVLLAACQTNNVELNGPIKGTSAFKFDAPALVSDSEFEFDLFKSGTNVGKTILWVRGEGEDAFIFKVHADRRGLWNFDNKIRFPLVPGKSWEYSEKKRRPWCTDHVNRYWAKVASHLERAMVNGRSYDVVRITHNGKWSANCQSTDLEGELLREFLYSPKLGMIVWSTIKIWSVQGDLQGHNEYVLAKATIPSSN